MPFVTQHGHTRPESPTYVSWRSMKRRTRPGGKYTAKGIGMDPRWQSFVAFLADMGERPEGTTLDRIDGAKGYGPSNCRWATSAQQAETRGSAWDTGARTRLADRETCLHGHVLAEVGIYEYGRNRTCRACAADRRRRYEGRADLT